jgi:carboxypeptidase Q
MTKIRFARSSTIAVLFSLVLGGLIGNQTVTARQAAANPFSAATIEQMKRLQEAALKSDYAYKQVQHLTNNIGPRLSGSAQAQKAVDYVAGEMKRLGLDVQLEKVMVPHWVRGVETGALVQFAGQAPNTTQKIVLTALGGSTATPAEGVTADVVVVNDFDELNALGHDKVAGKIVLFNHHYDKELAATGFGGDAYGLAVVYRAAGPSAAGKLGAAAALVRSVGNADYRLPHTGSLRYTNDAPKIPSAAVSAEDGDLLAYLAKEGPVKMHLTLTPQQLPDVESFNVIGDLKGSEHPEQIVIVSGHLDSWDLGTGAIDDAAGVAVAMATAQLLKQLNIRPKRTIRFIAWMNEENGGAGGRAYAEDHKSEIANHIAAIESDLGAGHPIGFLAKASPAAMQLLAPVSAILERSGAGLSRAVDQSPESDITPISLAGVPAFGLFQDSRYYFMYHHTPADTLDKIVPKELAENATVMAVLAFAIASLPQPLPR